MNTVFTFVSIILLILIVSFIVMINKIVTLKKKKYMSGQKIRWVLGIYITVLLISMALYYLIPTKSNSSSENIVDRSFPYLSEKIYNGSTEELDEKYITKHWDFEYSASTLRISGESSDQGGSVYVMEKSEDDNQIDVILYQTPSYVEGIEITDKINLPYINLSSGNLTIGNKEETNLEYTAFKPELTISQFTGDEPMDIENSYTRGERVLIIKIPKGLEIQEESMWFEYLQEQ